MAQSAFTEIVVTDTIPIGPEKRNGKFTVLPVAPLLGEAIYRIHKGLSVGEMFNQLEGQRNRTVRAHNSGALTCNKRRCQTGG